MREIHIYKSNDKLNLLGMSHRSFAKANLSIFEFGTHFGSMDWRFAFNGINNWRNGILIAMHSFRSLSILLT